MVAAAMRLGAGAFLVLGMLLLPGPWGPSNPGLRPGEPGLSVGGGNALRGEALYRDRNCMRCHSVPRTAGGTNAPTDLSIAGSRAPADWMRSYLHDPKPLRYASEGVRPRLRMPAFPLTDAEASDLVAFLSIQEDTVRIPPRPDVTTRLHDEETIEEGRVLFEEYQCLGCHMLNNRGNEVGPNLDNVGARRNPEYVAALLGNPKNIVPGTAMEDKSLWENEITSLTVYLMSRKTQ